MRCPARVRIGAWSEVRRARKTGEGGSSPPRVLLMAAVEFAHVSRPSPPSLAAHRGGCMSVRQRALRSAPLIGFGLAIVFLALSLYGYDPADPPGRGAEPANVQPSNPCGPVGAALAHVLFTTLGWSTWLVPPALLVVNVHLVRRRAGARPGRVRRSGSRWCSWSPPRRSTSWRRRSGPARRSAAGDTSAP